MLSTTQFTQITLNDFSELEIGIIEKLVFHDIVLRRELPNDSLINIGSENISFTYDDLRDFIVAHYIVFNLAMRSLEEATEFVSALRTDDIIFEGVFKYVYVLSRKAKNRDLELACEEATDFTEHYIQNLNLISPHIQNSDDQVRVARWLRDDIHRPLKRRLAIFLFQRRNESHLLNTKILISHISELSDGEIEEFLEIMFAPRVFDWANHWQNNINNLTKQIIAIPNEEFDELDWKVLACVLQSCSWANQDTFEQFLNKLSSFRSHANVISALEFCENSKSQRIANAIFEIRSV